MRRWLKITLCIAIFTPLTELWAQTLLVAGDEEKEGSYLVEITRQAFRRVGFQTEFIFVPWSRALQKSIEGKYDVLLAAYYTPKRAKKLTYSQPIGSADVVLLKLKSTAIQYHSVQDLAPYRIGHIDASKVSEEFDAAEKTYLNIEYAYNAETNIRKLLAGRIDLLVEKRARIDKLLKTEFRESADKVEFLDPPLSRNHFHNCVSNSRADHLEIISAFNQGLKLIKEDGTFGNIMTIYQVNQD